MDRRDFLSGLVGAALLARSSNALATAVSGQLGFDRLTPATEKLFPSDTIMSVEPTEFSASGFSRPVCGVVYRRAAQAECGVPIGTIDTGCIDLDTDGTFGYCSLFGSFAPPRGPLGQPFLGVTAGNQSWVLSLPTQRTRELEKTSMASEIHYWGHYPVADLEYETDSPLGIGLRAWSPFIPGDVAISNTPGAVFELRIRNRTLAQQTGVITFSFPGPSQGEAQISPTSPRIQVRDNYNIALEPIALPGAPPRRQRITGSELNGISVASRTGVGYTIALLGPERVHTGTHLGADGILWATSVDSPFRNPAENDLGASVAVDFDLAPREARTVRFVLAWYAPLWKGEGSHCFRHMYAQRYPNSVAVAHMLARTHKVLLGRILNWQQAIYADESLPVWLRDALVNSLYMITEDGLWGVADPPIGDWCRKQDGLFAMSESPRECPQMECIPCSFYGNIPLAYFFPELALSTLRAYKAYQYPDGAAPWVFGGISARPATEGTEIATPNRGYQTTTNGISYADMVDKYWLRTGDDAFLREFYPSVKQNMIYTMGLNPSPDGVISMPTANVDPATGEHATEWVEAEGWYGMTAHVGGLHLAQLRIVKRMAEKVGDAAFAAHCQRWFEQGSLSMESKLWKGQYYMAYRDPASGRHSDCIFSCQLDGDWIASFHGLPPIFQRDRAQATLTTIRQKNAGLSPYGTVFFANPDGTPWDVAGYGPYTYFVSEQLMLAMTYMYAGDVEFGIEQARRCMANLVQKGYTWNQPCIIQAATGRRISGYDYYQNLMLWSIPAALARRDLSGPCRKGGLVDRVITAGKTAL